MNDRIISLQQDTDGQDPVTRAYLAAHRSTCAWRLIAWSWLVIGVVAALAGGCAASLAAGRPDDAPAHASGLVLMLHTLLGNPWAALGGMLGGAVAASVLGILAGRGNREAKGQEPLAGGALVALAYLLLFDWLACLGVVVGLITTVTAATIAFRLLALAAGGRRGERSAEPAEPPGGWPRYTILVPLYKEKEVADSILASLGRLDYPRDRLDVKFLLEADDPDTLPALVAAGIPEWAEVVIVPQGQPKTKPRACNHGLARATGDLLVIFDAEDRPEPDQLKQAAAAFAALPPEVVCLQAQLAYHNHDQNLLTRWFAIEYDVWFRRYLPGLVRLGVPIPLGGTSNHFRTPALRDLGGWDPFNVTEDCDLGVRLYMRGLRTRTLDSITWEEANSRTGNWIRQRSRWLKGYLATHLVWARNPYAMVLALGPWGAAGFLLSVLFVSALSAFNLLLWLGTGAYAALIAHDLFQGYALTDLLTMRLDPELRWSWPLIYRGPDEDPLFSGLSLVFAVASAALFTANLLFIAIALVWGVRPGRPGNGRMVVAALLSPLYWALIGIAAWKGIWQLLVAPHKWEKTLHGLDKPAA